MIDLLISTALFAMLLSVCTIAKSRRGKKSLSSCFLVENLLSF